LRDARRARLLSWLSLGWMTLEGGVGVLAGILAGSVALIGFGLSSAVEGLAAVIVIWRFTGSRTHSDSSERSAQRAVAVSFWLLAPYVAVEAVHKLVSGEHPETSVLGIGLTASSLVLMPLLGRAKLRLGGRLGSGATAGEGTQNMLCALLAAAVLVGLLGQTLLGAWWLDPLAALFVAGVAVREGLESWRGETCGDCAPIGFDASALHSGDCSDLDGHDDCCGVDESPI
jgi:divalent metal cation (Fe/Co/Zn/Cd) transporter